MRVIESRLLLVLVVGLILSFWPKEAMAQNGACPPSSVLLGSPHSIYPSDAITCTYNYNMVSLQNDDDDYFPCEQYIEVSTLDLLFDDTTHSVVIVPPGTLYYGDEFRVRFFLVYGNNLIEPPANVEADINFYYYDNSGVYVTSFSAPLSNYNYVSTYYEILGANFYYHVYFVDQILNVGSANIGGYVRTNLTIPDEAWNAGHVPLNFKYASIQMGGSADILPVQCSIPNSQLPTTPTPGPTATGTLPPTWTPEPGATTTPTPISTPFPTATGEATILPTWTLTPITFPTIPAENTPTPWPPYTIPTIAFPTPSWPTPNPTIVAGSVATQEASSGLLETLRGEVVDDWSTRIARLDPWTNPSITTTNTISTPQQISWQIAQNIAKPISYVKGLQEIAPNAWPYIAFLLGAVFFVIFNVLAKFAIRLAVTLLEIVRRLWEMIPFN